MTVVVILRSNQMLLRSKYNIKLLGELQHDICESYSCVIVVFMIPFFFSHGKDGVVYASDGQSINMEYIYEFFNNRCKMKPMECS